MGNMHLVTGYQGQEHITAADHGSLYAAIFGSGSYVLDRGNKLAATVITNNQVRIADGDLVIQGRHVRLNEGTTVDLTIENGAQGYKRNDLIVARYTRNASTGVEEVNLAVIKGTATNTDPTDPEYVNGDLLNDHAETVEVPLYRISLDGLTVGTPTRLIDVAYLVTLGSDKKVPAEYLPAMNYIPTNQKGAKNGVASLDSTGKVPSGQLPSMNYIPTSQKGAASGVAPLNSSKVVPVANGGTGAADNQSACSVLKAHFLGPVTTTPTVSDFNSLTTPGVYRSTKTMTANAPSCGVTDYGVIVVECWAWGVSGVIYKQTYRTSGTTYSGSTRIDTYKEYVRFGSSSSWKSWELASEISCES